MLSSKENNTTMLCFHVPCDPCWGTGYQDLSFSCGKRARDSLLCMFGVRFLPTAQGWALMLVRKYLASTVMQITFFWQRVEHLILGVLPNTLQKMCFLSFILPSWHSLQSPSKTVSPIMYHLSSPFLCFTSKGHLGQMEEFGLSNEAFFKLSSATFFLRWNFQPYLELKHGFNQF